eukprot:TRINITY_DN15830_c0_g1_i1.p1 TRINITY_DN15830_c0_g1~~TRINITY_DN15830_c0_g1_i1.p1  ORF type:complete len:315 (+),score=61.86 TRINITY_DN15830_c0_g1_i1:121-945(+)
MASTIAGYPPDTIKVRLQTQSLTNPRYSSAIHCLFKMVREEGLVSLFRGMSTPLFSRAIINAVSFSTYTHLLHIIHTDDTPPSLFSLFLAGGGAGAFSALIAGPTELIKVQLQVAGTNIPVSEGPILQARRVFRSLGVRGMFIGVVPTILRDFLCLGTFFAVSAALNRKIASEIPGGSTASLSILTGAIGGITGWAICYPLDVWKSNVQNFVPRPGAEAPKKGMTLRQFFTTRYHTMGIRSLYSGLAATLFRAGPVNGAKFFTFEAVLRLLHKF